MSFTVADRDASAAAAESLGGTVESSDDNEWTRTATIRDPEGARFVLSQFTPPRHSAAESNDVVTTSSLQLRNAAGRHDRVTQHARRGDGGLDCGDGGGRRS